MDLFWLLIQTQLLHLLINLTMIWTLQPCMELGDRGDEARTALSLEIDQFAV